MTINYKFWSERRRSPRAFTLIVERKALAVITPLDTTGEEIYAAMMKMEQRQLMARGGLRDEQE